MKILSMTTLRELMRLSLPMVLSQGSFAVMIFTDRWFMSQIDATHIAAAMGGGVAAFFCMSLFMGVISYGNAMVAQYYGSGQIAKCPRVVTQGLIISVACTPLLLLLAYLGAKVFSHLGHDPAQVQLERVYFLILMGGSFFTLVKACLAGYFAGIGRTRMVMTADVICMLINVPLSWMLIFGKFGLPQLGLAGAGLGTVIATLCPILLYLLYYLSQTHQRQFQVSKSFVFDRGVMRRYLRLGTPTGIEGFLNAASFNLFLLLFQSYGVIQGAAMAIVFNWDMVCFIPIMGLNIGVMTLIGRFVGAQDMARANQVISSGFILALGYSGILAVLYLIFRVSLVDVFKTPGEEFIQIRELASQMMIGLATYMLADAVRITSSAALRGAGDTRWIMMTSISIHWVMLIAQYFVIVIYDYGPLVSWWLFVSMLITLAILYLWRLLRGRWRHPERLARVMRE
ncbi:MAG: MATE family efflux transporter [Halioglobus sp.]